MKKDKKLLHRMVFSYTVVFGAVFLAIVGVLYWALSNNSREQARLNNQVLAGQPLKQLDRFLSGMDDVAYKAMTNDVLIRKFTELREDAAKGNHFDQNVLESIDTATVVAALNSRIAPMRRIIVYNDHGDYISSGAMVDHGAAESVLESRGVPELMRSFRDGERDYIVGHPQKDDWMAYFKSDYFTFTRPVMNPYSRDVVGIVEVQYNKAILEEYLKFPENRDLAVNVYDELGNPVMVGDSPGYTAVATAVSDLYGWSVELLEPESVMQNQQRELLEVLALTWLLLTLAVFAIICLISSSISRPIVKLTKAVEGISPGAPQRVEAVGGGISEITALESEFNRMLERLTLSMNQEKQSFLLAMQAQMNPHFLYNVLSVVNAVALEGKSDAVVSICGNLSAMLRYSSSYADSVTTLGEELKFTADYLELMKARYDYMFTYTINADDALRAVTIPKLIVQPICENCFAHAFSNREPPYRIAIDVKSVGGGFAIRVADNGAGFDEASRKAIIERANSADYGDLSRMHLGGLGLVSSVVRLKLLTGRRVICDVNNLEGGGSRVEITVLEVPE